MAFTEVSLLRTELVYVHAMVLYVSKRLLFRLSIAFMALLFAHLLLQTFVILVPKTLSPLEKVKSVHARYPPHSSCTLSPNLHLRYGHLLTSNRTFLFGISLHNSESILPHLSRQLLDLADFLGPHRFKISVYESGSKDATPDLLESLGWYFDIQGIESYFVTRAPTENWRSGHRIFKMAKIRNQVLKPLFADVQSSKSGQNRKYDTLVFLNDILFCTSDILELLTQHLREGADVTCPLDFMTLWENMAYYDLWVGRTMAGDLMYNAFPNKMGQFETRNGQDLFWKDKEAQERAAQGLPVQVMSCWNGVAVMSTDPFYSIKPMPKFRRSNSLFECSESEAWLILKDFWKAGYGKIMVVPNVAVAYEMKDFLKVRTRWENIKTPDARIKPFFSEKLNSDCKSPACLQRIDKNLNWKLEPPKMSMCYPMDWDGQYEAQWSKGHWVPTLQT